MDKIKSAIQKLVIKNQKIRLLTSPIRLLPSFIIIGGQKCGTTSLFKYLLEHPSVSPPLKKEPHFFESRYKSNLNWYRLYFPTCFVKSKRPDLITGEASTGYIYSPHAPKRIAQSIPQVKLILLLRNPVDRAYSHYNHTVRWGKETLSFKEAIVREEERLKVSRARMIKDGYYSFELHYYSYISRGIYIDQLKNWLLFFKREQILILRSEDLYTNPENIYKKVLDFLELPQKELKNVKPYNSGVYQDMDTATRQQLINYFKPHNERLYEYLGTDFYWH